MECIIFIGIPASGKSTYYKRHFSDSHLRINLDMLGRRSREKAIFEAAVKSKIKIVIDNTNTQIADREKYIPLLKKNNYKIIAYYFRTDFEKAIEANKKRIRKIPEDVIRKYYAQLVKPRPDEGFDEIYRIIDYNKIHEMNYIGMIG